MTQPAQTYNVKVLDPNDYQTVSTGILGLTLDPNDKTTATCVLGLAGKIVVDDLELKGIYSYFSKLDGGMIMIGANVMFAEDSDDNYLRLFFTAWGDTGLIGYLAYGSGSADSDKPYIILNT